MVGTDEGDGHAAFHTANIMLFCITCKKKYHFLGRNITEISLRTMQVMRVVGGFVIFVILLFEDCIVTRNGNIWIMLTDGVTEHLDAPTGMPLC